MSPDHRANRRAQAAEMGATCACFNIRKAARAVTQLYDDMLRPSGLRATQLTLLTLTRGHGSISIGRLADAAGTDRTTLTRNLEILEERGLVRIRSGEDARTRVIELTEAGDDAVDVALPLWRKAQATVTGRMGRDGLSRLLAELSAVERATAGEGA